MIQLSLVVIYGSGIEIMVRCSSQCCGVSCFLVRNQNDVEKMNRNRKFSVIMLWKDQNSGVILGMVLLMVRLICLGVVLIMLLVYFFNSRLQFRFFLSLLNFVWVLGDLLFVFSLVSVVQVSMLLWMWVLCFFFRFLMFSIWVLVEWVVIRFSIQGILIVQLVCFFLLLGRLNRVRLVGVGWVFYLVLMVVSLILLILLVVQFDLLFRMIIERVVVRLKLVVIVKECSVKVVLWVFSRYQVDMFSMNMEVVM